MHEVGGHVSAAGGVELALDRAVEIGGNCMQLFSGSPRVWARPDIKKFDAEKIAAKRQEKQVGSIITHSLYLVNLASDNPELVEKSKRALAFDLLFDAHIKGNGVVVHVGSHKGSGWEQCRDGVAAAIADLIDHTPKQCHFLIENAASRKGKIGGDLAEIAWLIDRLSCEQVGWCFDTCHAFAAGYGLGQVQPKESAVEMTAEQAISHFGLWTALKCVHVNDSRDPFASERDRHANLGDGLIPLPDLEYFVNLPQLRQLPLILEVPGIDKEGPDQENIHRLKRLTHQE